MVATPSSGAEIKINITELQCFLESNYAGGITLKHVISGIHFCSLAAGQHSSEGTSQRWRVAAALRPMVKPSREPNPRSTALIAMCSTTELTRR